MRKPRCKSLKANDLPWGNVVDRGNYWQHGLADQSRSGRSAGFGLLLLGVMSYISHWQIWALQADGKFYVGGKTNRVQVAFERETIELLDRLSPS